MATIHEAAMVESRQVGGHNSVIYTWGLPTTGANWSSSKGAVLGQIQTMPGNGASGNTPAYQTTGWTVLGAGDSCIPVFLPGAQDRSVQIQGTFGGATVAIVGCNDGVNFVNLTDALQGASLAAISAAGLYNLYEKCAWIGVVITGGGGSTALNVILSTRQPS